MLNPEDFVTILIRDDCSQEPRAFSKLTEAELQGELRHAVECGASEMLVAVIDPAKFRRFKNRPAVFEEVTP